MKLSHLAACKTVSAYGYIVHLYLPSTFDPATVILVQALGLALFRSDARSSEYAVVTYAWSLLRSPSASALFAESTSFAVLSLIEEGKGSTIVYVTAMRIRTSAKTVLIEYRDHGLLYRKDGDLEVLLETDPITSQMNHSRITMYAIRLFPFLILTCLVYYVTSAPARGKSTGMIKPYAAAPRQDIVTWDEHSIMVRGERILLYSGEFHPFRLPVPSLWLDIFQKIKAAGFSGVSFYADW